MRNPVKSWILTQILTWGHLLKCYLFHQEKKIMLSKVSINFSYLRSKCVIVLPYTKIHPRISGHLGSLSHVKMLGKIHCRDERVRKWSATNLHPSFPQKQPFQSYRKCSSQKKPTNHQVYFVFGKGRRRGKERIFGQWNNFKVDFFCTFGSPSQLRIFLFSISHKLQY